VLYFDSVKNLIWIALLVWIVVGISYICFHLGLLLIKANNYDLIHAVLRIYAIIALICVILSIIIYYVNDLVLSESEGEAKKVLSEIITFWATMLSFIWCQNVFLPKIRRCLERYY
jgi:amino acid permease